jgi:hypothetical protein
MAGVTLGAGCSLDPWLAPVMTGLSIALAKYEDRDIADVDVRFSDCVVW